MTKFPPRFFALLMVLLLSGIAGLYAMESGVCAHHYSPVLPEYAQLDGGDHADQGLSLIAALPPVNGAKHTVKAHVAEVIEEKDGLPDEFSLKRKSAGSAVAALLSARILAALFNTLEVHVASRDQVGQIPPCRLHLLLRVLII